MSDDMKIVLFAVAVVVGILLIRFIISKIVYKGTDAIKNAIVERKNEKAPKEPESLADRYKSEE